MKKELFDTEVLASLVKMSLSEAKATALDMASKMPKKTINQSTSVNRIIHDIEKAPTPAEVSRIMYQVYLSGTGLGTVGSSWKKHYANI